MGQEAAAAQRACASIMIVEDDPDIRDSLRYILENEGYRVMTAENGQEAFDVLAKIPRPCLILLDLMMPVMNGWEFLDQRQGDVALATIPVVIVSAITDRAKSAQASGFIKKPVDLARLIEAVTTYCGKPAASKPAA
jgi:CheY-like chemotaxis protein